MNEAETRAEHIDPALAAAGWGVAEGSRIRREYFRVRQISTTLDQCVSTPGRQETVGGVRAQRRWKIASAVDDPLPLADSLMT